MNCPGVWLVRLRKRIRVGYPSDVTETTLLARPASVGAVLLRQVEKSPSKEAFRYIEDDRWVSLSYAQTKDKAFQLDLSDDIQQGALITHEGNVAHARTREALDKR